MKVCLIENNLFWSARITHALKALGHEITPIAIATEGTVAIVNLHDTTELDLRQLKSRGIRILAHAGHKETQLLSMAKAAECNRIASNGELTHKLPALLEETANA